MKEEKISIIIPLYNEEDNITPLYNEIVEVLKNNFSNFDYEIIFVNDGSIDASWNKICSIKKNNKKIIAINLQRNYGQSTALQV